MRMPWKSRPGFTQAQRAAVLRLQPICQCEGCAHCGSGCARRAVEVDHIMPRALLIRSGDPSPDRIDNARGMCADCHATKTARERQEGRERIAAKARHPHAPAPGLLS